MAFGLLWIAGYLGLATVAIRFATRPRRRAHRIDAVAAERAARIPAPAVETRPGFDREALAICNAIPNGPKGDQP
ncbi:hypothetical protein [Streptomyces sp. NPDC004230]